MALSDRAAAVSPYVEQLLHDKEVQSAARRAVGATREAYARARGKSARQALEDKKLRRRLQQALAAAWEAWSAIEQPAPRRKARWSAGLVLLAAAAAGVFLALNPQAREKVMDLLGKDDESHETPPHETPPQ
jgi:hypothetical protein